MLSPLNGRIVVRPDEQKTETATGIILLEKENDMPVTGIALTGSPLVPEGSHIVFSKYGFDEVEYEGESLYLVSETNVLATFE